MCDVLKARCRAVVAEGQQLVERGIRQGGELGEELVERGKAALQEKPVQLGLAVGFGALLGAALTVLVRRK